MSKTSYNKQSTGFWQKRPKPLMQSVRFQVDDMTHFHWRSYKKFFAILGFGCFLVFIAYLRPLTGDFKAQVVLLIGFVFIFTSIVAIARKGVWVETDELGVKYRNLFSVKTVCWGNILQSYTFTIRCTTCAYIKTTSGKSITLPISGRRAIEICETINRLKSEQKT
ncbi:hypothetical protein ACOI22_04255 [Glaciecola sp. 2405UD65-10]|uniref:hypothetical protein n=1 Tax=Glaciecola sp. 2405UD65-10 TaxID=3397244 RepID=UPI003B59F01C